MHVQNSDVATAQLVQTQPRTIDLSPGTLGSETGIAHGTSAPPQSLELPNPLVQLETTSCSGFHRVTAGRGGTDAAW